MNFSNIKERQKVKHINLEKKIFENTYNEKSVNVSKPERKRISPTIIPDHVVPVPNNNTNNNFKNIPESDIVMQDLSKQQLKKEMLEKKPICCKITQFDSSNIYLIWENKIYDNFCTITLQINDKYLYSNKYEGKMIRLFAYNNFFYVYYDTQNLIHVNTLFNNIVNLYN
jgi:hypothetical protein